MYQIGHVSWVAFVLHRLYRSAQHLITAGWDNVDDLYDLSVQRVQGVISEASF